ncbi:MAG: calcium-binding protein, partial [Pseudomonadota bacterium]
MAEFVVTTLDDESEDNGTLSLREAMALANDAGGADSITFAEGLEGTIRLDQGPLFSFDVLAIDGDGRITISGDVAGDDVVDESGITDVAASQEAAGDLLSDNVALFRSGNSLTLEGLVLTGGVSDFGGAVATSGTLTILDSAVSGNYATGDGGGVNSSGDVRVENSVVSGNVSGADGGGIFAGDEVTVVDSEISGNVATAGGGVFADFGVTVTDSVISGNSADEGGGLNSANGDIAVTGTTLAENAANFGAAAYASGVFNAVDSVVRDNEGDYAAFAGAGFNIERTLVAGNIGGGVMADSGASTVVDSVFIENEGFTGAIFSSGTVTVTGSLFQDNVGTSAGAIYDAGYGLTVVNSTFVGNTGGDDGGAIASRGPLTLDHVTVTGNTSTGAAGAVNVTSNDSTGTITNSIIAGNVGGGAAGPDLTDQGGYVPYSGTITFTGLNIVGANEDAFDASSFGNAFNADPALIFEDEVADNGGPTPTLALIASADNPALDASDTITRTGDARGAPRPRDVDGVYNGGEADLGAFELNLANLNGVGIVDDGEFGAEEILGTDDDDTLRGGPAFDDSLPGTGQDTIRGFGGDDLLVGEGGADLIFGGDGDDTINGGGDFGDLADTIFGGDGNDEITGEAGDDLIFGGEGDDVIDGGAGSDEIDGGAGDDTIRITETDFFGAFDAIDGGDDVDTLDFSGVDADFGVSVD